MKRRYACSVPGNHLINFYESESGYFKGYVCYTQIYNVEKPLIVNNGIYDVCLMDNGYEWFQLYPIDNNYVLTIMLNDDKVIQWYFDVSKNIGIENGIPYEDDLYLDMVITKEGKKLILDENELLDAYNSSDITKDDVDNAYKILEYLEKKYYGDIDSLKNFTNDLKDKYRTLIKKEGVDIMDIVYKKYNNNDYEFIYNLKKDVYKDYVIKYYGEYNDIVQRDMFNKRINDIKDNTYIIYYKGIKVGFYTVKEYERYREIENICILKDYQGLGIGTKVLKNIINIKKDIKLQYFKCNPVGDLYRRLGFIYDGENEFHYKMIRKGR